MIKINLLAKKVSKKKAGVIQDLSIGAGVLVVVLAAMGWLWVDQSRRLGRVHQQIAVAETEKQRLKNVNEDKVKFEKEKGELDRKLNIITKLQKERIIPVHLLDEITKVVDTNAPIWIDKYGYADDGVSIDGYSLSHEALRPIVDGLERSPYYRDVELLFSERTEISGREVYRFSIKSGVEQPG